MSKFTVIFCDDIREERGNKKSLMGVVSGDVLAASFPATLQIALFIEYEPDASHRDAGQGDSLKVEFRLMQDDTEIAKGNMLAKFPLGRAVNFVLPKGLVSFEKPATFRVLVSVDGGAEEEILSKKILPAPGPIS